MNSQALAVAKSHLVGAAAALGPHVTDHHGINGNVMTALEQIERAVTSVILSEVPTLTDLHYDHEPLSAVMHVWGKASRAS